jgi:hypothetical protein
MVDSPPDAIEVWIFDKNQLVISIVNSPPDAIEVWNFGIQVLINYK